MKLLLVGCGAVGLAVASALYAAGEGPDLVARGETREAILQNGLARVGALGEARIIPARVRVYEAVRETPGGYDAVLVAVKATAAAEIAAQLAGHAGLLAPQGRVVLLQNGYGAEQPYLSAFEKERFVQASISIGFAREAASVSRVTVFSAPIHLGSLYGDQTLVAGLAAAIAAGGIPCETDADIGRAIWAKMLYNVSLNALGAVLGASYGQLESSPHAVLLIRAAIEETYAVMRAGGFSAYQPDAAAYEKVFFEQILPPTHAHRASTLQDVEAHRKTEVDALNGVIVRLGERFGVPTPVNRTLLDLVHAKEDLF